MARIRKPEPKSDNDLKPWYSRGITMGAIAISIATIATVIRNIDTVYEFANSIYESVWKPNKVEIILRPRWTGKSRESEKSNWLSKTHLSVGFTSPPEPFAASVNTAHGSRNSAMTRGKTVCMGRRILQGRKLRFVEICTQIWI
jgi:hypothetical protein